MGPFSPFARAMLNDKYQFTMAYAYWKSGRHEIPAVFDLFFRANPFKGEFTIFAGLEQVLRLVASFRFTQEDIMFLQYGYNLTKETRQVRFQRQIEAGYIRSSLRGGYERINWGPHGIEYWEPVEYPQSDLYIEAPMEGCHPDFFKWLDDLDCSKISIHAIKEGSVVFPRVPLIRVKGPIGIGQLLETPMLNLVNFPSLVATSAACLRLAAGDKIGLLEFGCRRAQGTDGAMSASLYSVMGGFDATSNMLAAQQFGIESKGTHAHSFVSSYIRGLTSLKDHTIVDSKGRTRDFVKMVLKIREELGFINTNEGELAALIAYAQAFPHAFLALVDTFDTLKSGVPNFLCVAVALHQCGYRPIGIRLDSGDLAYLSKESRKMFIEVGKKYSIDYFGDMIITASNDIDRNVLQAMNEQGHGVDVLGIGTRQVTCWPQPALGCVYKLVWVDGQPCMKISNNKEKTLIPGEKFGYRLIGHDGYALTDILVQEDEAAPLVGQPILCRHPFDETKRVAVRPSRVIPLHDLVWSNGKLTTNFPSLQERGDYVREQLKLIRSDHLRSLNPTPYKVALSEKLYAFMHNLWQKEAPIEEIS